MSDTAEWTSSNPSVLSVAAGLATGRANGEATVTARFEGQQTDPAPVMVLPVGTYRLRGTVTLPNSATAVVPTARVEVPEVGLVTTADPQGRFVLYGVPPGAEIHVTKDGYAPTVTSFDLRNHLMQVRITIRPQLEGAYTLSIGPGTCFLRGCFSASQCFFSSLLGTVTQLNGLVLDYGAGLFASLWGEQ